MSIEVKGVDLGVSLVLLVGLGEIIVIPDSDVLVLTSGSNVLAVGGDSQSVDVVIVGLDGGVEFEDTGPDLESTVSSGRGVVVVLPGLGVSDFANPAEMVVVLRLDLALSEGVPDEEVLLGAAGEDLSVVARESDTVDLLAVSNESLEASGVSDIPESESLVPGGRDEVALIAREGQVRDEVTVSGKGLEGLSEMVLLEFGGQVPDDQSFISGSGDEDGVFITSGAS